jgi:hypothetical protein
MPILVMVERFFLQSHIKRHECNDGFGICDREESHMERNPEEQTENKPIPNEPSTAKSQTLRKSSP